MCGNERAPCADGRFCCTNGVDVECADVRTDRFHCGACNRICAGSERCEDGVCTLGEGTCAEACEGSQICCNGSCCERFRCVGGTCGSGL